MADVEAWTPGGNCNKRPMSNWQNRDVVVIGSGPNGLAAAITMARAGCTVTVYEAEPTIGGGARSGALTLPGFIHDVCSSVHALAAASPFVQSLNGRTNVMDKTWK